MSEGLAKTFEVLTKTGNEAAARVLIPALDSQQATIQEGALRAILARRSPAGGREVVRRLHTISDRWKQIILEHRGRLGRTLRDAVLGTDRQMCVNGCRAAVWLREYDLIPTLLTLLEDRTKENADLGAATLLEMVDQLHQDSAGPRDLGDRRDPQLMCRHVLGSLEGSVKRFDRHGRREVVEAFLLLAGRDNVTLNQILQDPHHAAFLITIEVLSSSSNGTVMRLLLSFLDDPHAPSAVLSVVANRGDLQFVRHLLRKIGREPSLTVSQNLKRVRSVGWLHRGEAFLQQLDDAAQHATIRLAMTARIPRLQVFATIECLLLHGKPGGRREAARALGEFRGADANALAVKALDDPDPQVQANAVVQLRRRGIPGVLPRLVGLVDSPHAVVREAAQENLDEFSFDRFVQAFDMLDDEVRRSTGVLVSKIDPQTVPRLREEMAAQARGRRLRALAIARTIDAVRQLEGAIIRLLKDKDHLIRAEAAASLARCSSTRSQQALEAALADSSTAVREAARKSLDTRKRFTQWLESLAEPRE